VGGQRRLDGRGEKGHFGESEGTGQCGRALKERGGGTGNDQGTGKGEDGLWRTVSRTCGEGHLGLPGYA